MKPADDKCAIDSEIPIPEELPTVETKPVKPLKVAKKTPRARKKAQAQNPAIASLLEPLKFIAQVQKKAGTPSQQFCAISGGWVVASNGVCMLASPIELDLSACVHTVQFIDALTKCGQELAIAQLNENAISVNSEQFKALIACESFANIELQTPDDNVFELSEHESSEFVKAVDCVRGLATDGAANATYAGVAIQDGSAVATNGAALLECWHGLRLPTMLLPAQTCAILAKLGGEICGFGYSGTSATFWLRGGGFVRSALFAQVFPPYRQLLDVPPNPWVLPVDFFKAVHAVKDFSQNGIVYFDNGFVSSREVESEATTYKIEGLPNALAFDSRQLALVEHAMKEAQFDTIANRCFFFSEKSRGVVMGVDLGEQKAHAQTFENRVPF